MTFGRLWLWDNPSLIDLVDASLREEWNRKSVIRIPEFVTENIVKGEEGRRRG